MIRTTILSLVLLLALMPIRMTEKAGATQSDVQNGAHSTTLYFPILKLGQGWQVSISLTNLESEEVEVALTIYDTHGFSLGEIAGVIQAGGTTTLDAQSLPFGAASLKVESNGRLVGHALLRAIDGKKLEALPAIKESSRQLDFPPLVDGDASYKTIILFNPNSTLASARIVALDESGKEVDGRNLPPLSSMESRSLSLVDILDGGTIESVSTIRVESDSSIIGLQLVDYPEGDLAGLPALTTRSNGWIFPVITKRGDLELWTEVGIFNPGDVVASITVEAFDVSNNSLGIIQSVSLVQEQLIP
ncbi:MAG: hypothetical protein QXQ53_07335 [Candidatus Methanosuratincola sp.]